MKFEQKYLLEQIHFNPNIDKTLFRQINLYDGLCETICNLLLIDDLLGKNTNFDITLTIEALIKSKAKHMHVLSKNLDAIYNLIEYSQSLSNSKLQEQQIAKLLTKKSLNSYIKVLLKAKASKIKGHSILIKKLDDNSFSHFDCNYGEQHLNLNDLIQKINKDVATYSAANLILLDGDRYAATFQHNKENIHLSFLAKKPSLKRSSTIRHNLAALDTPKFS